VLQMVSQTLRGNIRETDAMGRWGGEEFLVILKDINLELLFKIGEKLIHLVRQSHLSSSDGHIVSVTISVGGTLVNKADTIDSLVDRADRLMYQSKANGRNRITIG
jgi:diguanylate cyclase (GGDEF)-like protein